MSFWDGNRWIDESKRARDSSRSSRIRDVLATMVIPIVVSAALIPWAISSAGAARLLLSPASGPSGTTIDVRGEGLPPKTKVQLSWDRATAGMPAATTNGRGRFRATIVVPTGADGPHAIAAMGIAGQDKASSGSAGVVLVSAVFTLAEPPAAMEPAPTVAPTEPAPAPTVAPDPTPTSTPHTTPAPTTAPMPTPAPTVAPPPEPPPADAFVSRSGTRLVVDGQAYRFTGLNIYNANSINNCWYTMGSGSGLADSLATIGGGQEAFRAWFFQRLATVDGQRDWSAFDHTLAAARASGTRVIATLTNQWGDCENASGSPVYKTEAWYRSEYWTTADPGMPATYAEWVRQVVSRYRNDPTILAWQLINEGEALTSKGGSCSSTAAATVDAWARDISAAIKEIDPNHLVSLGSISNGQCGTSTGTAFEGLHAIPTIDICEYHDYDSLSAVPGDAWNGLAVRLGQCHDIGKPMFVGEAGLKQGSAGSLAGRAAVFDAKFAAQFGLGIVGELIWTWQAAGQDSGDGYGVGPDDPALALFDRY